MGVPDSFSVLLPMECDVEGDWHNNWPLMLQKGTVAIIWRKMLQTRTAVRGIVMWVIFNYSQSYLHSHVQYQVIFNKFPGKYVTHSTVMTCNISIIKR